MLQLWRYFLTTIASIIAIFSRTNFLTWSNTTNLSEHDPHGQFQKYNFSFNRFSCTWSYLVSGLLNWTNCFRSDLLIVYNDLPITA